MSHILFPVSDKFFCVKQVLTHFMPLLSFYTPSRKSENQRFSDIFRGYIKRLVARNVFDAGGSFMPTIPQYTAQKMKFLENSIYCAMVIAMISS